jgi:hypothetical protein
MGQAEEVFDNGIMGLAVTCYKRECGLLKP